MFITTHPDIDIRSIIDQLCKKDLGIHHKYEYESLRPIDGVYKDLPVIKKSKYEFMVSMESDGNGYDDINLSVIDSKELLSKLNELGEWEEDFIKHLNKLIFAYLVNDKSKDIDMRDWNKESLWFKPYTSFYNWFEINDIDPMEDVMKKKKKNIPNNFRGKEDLFFKKIRDGLKKFLASPFKDNV